VGVNWSILKYWSIGVLKCSMSIQQHLQSYGFGGGTEHELFFSEKTTSSTFQTGFLHGFLKTKYDVDKIC
jgi:hypothetical protein